MKKRELQVHFLGNSSLEWNGSPLALGGEAASKPVQLLQMLLYYRAAGVSRSFAVENLFDVQGQVNPINNLRNTRFRLKKLLESTGMPPYEYMLVRGSRLYWNPALPFTLDVEVFEKAAAKARKEKDPARRREAMAAACALFTGRLLPSQAALPWVAMENLRLEKIFFDLIRAAAGSLEQERDFAFACVLYDRASEIEPYEEEWIMGAIRCEQRQGRHREALTRYEKAIGMFLEEFGVMPSEAFRHCMDNAGSESGFSSVLEIQDCIAQGYGEGAYFCHFAEFVHYCSLVSRMDARSGRATSLIWCSIQPPQNEACDPARRKERMKEAMLHTLRASLRSSDVFTQYGENQYLVLLPGSGNEDGSLVFDRLNADFKEQKGAYGYTLSLHAVPLVMPPAETAPAWEVKEK